MDLKQLNSIDTTNTGEVKALQTFLKSRGYYAGAIDGKWGGATTEGAVKLRGDLTEEAKTAKETAQSTAEAEKTKASGQLTKMLMETAPYAGGVVAGTAVGHYAGSKAAARDKAMADAAKRIANNPKISPEAKLAQLNEMNRGRLVRNTTQFAIPTILAGGAYATRNLIAPSFSDPTERDIINAIGSGEQAAALTSAAHQGLSTALRGNPIDDEIAARIRSDAAPRGPVPRGSLAAALTGETVSPAVEQPRAALPTPEPGGPSPTTPELRTHQDRAISAARAGGAKGIKTKADAIAWLEEPGNITRANRAAVAAELGNDAARNMPAALKRVKLPSSSVWLPAAIAGGAAYDAATSDAEAAGLTPAETRTRGAVAGGVAAGAAGGAGYGLEKAAPYLTRSMLGRALMKMLPPATAALSAFDTGDARANATMDMLNAFGWQGLPTGAPEMPERNPARVDEQNIARMRDEQVQRMPLPNASAIEIPTDIPPNAARDADLEAAFHPRINARLQRMINGGASNEQLAEFLNQAVR